MSENIDIRISEDGSRTVIVNINKIGDASRKSADGVDLLKTALGFLAGALAINKVKDYADAWSSASGQIAIATKNMQEAATVQGQLFKVAQKTRTGFSDMVELYTRAARAGTELGASQAQVIKFTEGVGKALAVQHTSATAASGALLQLGQALGAPKIQAQEFNSLLDGTPVILQTVARGMERTGGSIGVLTKLVKTGKVSNKEFFDAFLKGAEQLDADFAKSSMTIGQGLTVISNGLMKYIGELDHSLGISAKFGKVATYIAENMDMIGAAATALGVALAIAFSPLIILKFYQATKALFILLNTNPFIALAAGIGAVITFIALYGDEMNAGIDATTSLKDVLRALGEIFGKVFGEFVDVVKYAFGGFDEEAKKVPLTFASIVKGAAHFIDAIAGYLTGVGITIARVFTGLPALFSNIFAQIYNTLSKRLEESVNIFIGYYNTIRKLAGQNPIELVQFDQKDVNPKAFEEYGANIANGIEAGFASQGGFIEKQVDDVFKRASEIGKKRLEDAAKANLGAADLTGKIGNATDFGVDPAEAEKAAKALEKLKNSLRSLLNDIAPAQGALLEMAKAEDTLAQSVKKGLITSAQQDVYLIALKKHYEDVIDPLGKVNRDLAQQTDLLKLNTKEREIQSQLNKITEDLLKQSIQLNEEETTALRNKLTAYRDLNELIDAQDSLLAGSVQRKKDFTLQLSAVQDLLNDPNSGFKKSDALNAISGTDAGQYLVGSPEMLQAQVDGLGAIYSQIDELRQADLISEQTAQAAKLKVWTDQQTVQLSTAKTFFTSLEGLSKTNNNKIAAVGKAAAIANAIINTYSAATAAYAAMASIPYVGPALGVAAAAGAVALGLANVRQIRAQPTGFAEGGYTGNFARDQVAGVVHGQEFVMNAAATRSIGVENLQAMQTNGAIPQAVTSNNGAPATPQMALNVVITNKIDGAQFEVKQLDEATVEIIAERVLRKKGDEVTAGNIANPSSKTSRSMNKNTKTVRNV